MVGCAGTPDKVIVVSPTGAELPVPSYTLMDTSDGENKILATFWFAAYKSIIDIDASTHYMPTFLSLIGNDLKFKEYEKLMITIEVNNPQGILYNLGSEATIFYRGANNTPSTMKGSIASSNLPYRKYNFSVPYSEDINSAVFAIVLKSENDLVYLRLGDFHYAIKK